MRSRHGAIRQRTGRTSPGRPTLPPASAPTPQRRQPGRATASSDRWTPRQLDHTTIGAVRPRHVRSGAQRAGITGQAKRTTAPQRQRPIAPHRRRPNSDPRQRASPASQRARCARASARSGSRKEAITGPTNFAANDSTATTAADRTRPNSEVRRRATGHVAYQPAGLDVPVKRRGQAPNGRTVISGANGRRSPTTARRRTAGWSHRGATSAA